MISVLRIFRLFGHILYLYSVMNLDFTILVFLLSLILDRFSFVSYLPILFRFDQRATDRQNDWH